ncbi:S9 family peptidase [Parasphingorhabdus sp.]|uniref:S9 family peptidase n=1 Tax=Parasphingorhabdus sp. TaxID=2709688 RepID=UPI003002EC0C
MTVRKFESVTRRNLMLGIALGALGNIVVPGMALARKTGMSPANPAPVEPPVAPRRPFPIEQLGYRRDDPYHWMKYIPAQGTRSMENIPPMLRNHLLSETRYADHMLRGTRNVQAEIYEQIMRRMPASEAVPPLQKGGWDYYDYYPEGSAHIVYARNKDAQPEEILLDEGKRAAGYAYYRTTAQQPSPNHRYFAWAEDIKGDDRHRICVRDNQTGKIDIVVPDDAFGYEAVIFAPSSQWLFWIWRDARNRPTSVYRTALASLETVLVYEERDPAIFISIGRTAANGYIKITLAGPDTSEVRLIPAAEETAKPRIVYPRKDGVRYDVEQWGNRLLLLTDADGAIDRKLLEISETDMAITETIVRHRPGQQILSVLPFRGTLVRLERADGLHRLVLRQDNGQERSIGFDDPVFTLEIVPLQDYASRFCRILYQSPKTPRKWIDIDLESGEQSLVAQEAAPGFEATDYVAERMFATAPDGELVPITLLSRRDTPRDGSAPLLLYGYGAYGISSEPLFSVPATILADRGWNYAIAHVRGGSEKGQGWFLDGRKFHKRNSFTDFIACAEHIVSKKITATGNIVAYGLSAGGLLVGGAMNLAPDLWGGVIAKVPFVDMLNTMSDADHPLVPLFRPDWGDPLADPKAYEYIASISPYENVHPADYPPLLCTAGLKDDRVGYWEPAKLVAEVRHQSTSDNPAIFLIDTESGHQGSGNRNDEMAEISLFWGFAEQCVAESDRA